MFNIVTKILEYGSKGDIKMTMVLLTRLFNKILRRIVISSNCSHCAYFQKHVDIDHPHPDYSVSYYCFAKNKDILDHEVYETTEIKTTGRKLKHNKGLMCGLYVPRIENQNIIELSALKTSQLAIYISIISILVTIMALFIQPDISLSSIYSKFKSLIQIQNVTL